ncbi:MAG: DUF4129 domain-containing protein [Chlorobi bacterium]|nr:DUF4129 domain-containing protein [Chlorobiota bacterium]
MSKRGVIYLLFLSWLTSAAPIPADTVRYDRHTPLEPRYPEAPLHTRYRGRAFRYADENQTGRWEEIKSMLLNALRKLLGEGADDVGRWYRRFRTYFYFLVVALTAYYVLRRWKEESLPLEREEPQAEGVVEAAELAVPPERWRERALRAERRGDYRMAVRYRFLELLRLLEDKGWVRRDPAKTNREYAAEIGRDDLRHAFADAARLYDYFWFGKFPLDKSAYEHVRRRFTDLIRNI